MTFDHKTVKIQINCLLRKFLEDVSSSANMRRVADHHKVGIPSFHFDSHMPHGRIAVFGIAECTESTMNQTDIFNTRSEEHTSELQSLRHLVCRLLLEKKKE